MSGSCELDYEVEMALVMGREAKNLTESEAADAIFCLYGCQRSDGPGGAKAPSTMAEGEIHRQYLFPWVPFWVLADSVEFPPKRKIRSYVNEELRQEAETDDLLFSISTILTDLSKNFTLHPGDLILTGTPAGVGMGLYAAEISEFWGYGAL